MNKSGFSFIELVMAMLFLGVAILGFLFMNSYSKRETMDAYYELLAFSLAKEPIEVFRAFGYRWVATYDQHQLSRFPLGSKIVGERNTVDQYPFDSTLFEREISIDKNDVIKDGVRARKVTVKVRPAKMSRAAVWLSRSEVKLDAYIFDGPRR